MDGQTNKKIRRWVAFLAICFGTVGVLNIASELRAEMHWFNLTEIGGAIVFGIVPAILLARYARILKRTQANSEADDQAQRGQLAIWRYVGAIAILTIVFLAATMAYTIYAMIVMSREHDERGRQNVIQDAGDEVPQAAR